MFDRKKLGHPVYHGHAHHNTRRKGKFNRIRREANLCKFYFFSCVREKLIAETFQSFLGDLVDIKNNSGHFTRLVSGGF